MRKKIVHFGKERKKSLMIKLQNDRQEGNPFRTKMITMEIEINAPGCAYLLKFRKSEIWGAFIFEDFNTMEGVRLLIWIFENLKFGVRLLA